MKHFLLGLMLGIAMTGCAATKLQPVLTVHEVVPCADFQDLPYILDNSVPDDQLVCVATWPYRPMNPLVCLKAGELKKVIAGIVGT